MGQTTWYGLQQVVNARGGRAGQLHHSTAKRLLDGGLRAVKQADIRAAVLRALDATPHDYEQAVAAARATAADAEGTAGEPAQQTAARDLAPSRGACGLVREADAADPLAERGADPEDANRAGDLVFREANGDVDPAVSARLAQLAAVLAREAPGATPDTGAPPNWPTRVAWFARIGRRLEEWQDARAARWAPGGGRPNRPVPCVVMRGDAEHGETWTLADAVLHLVAFDPAGVAAAGRALADADAPTRAQLAAALLYVWGVERPNSPARLLDVLDAFAVHARPADAGPLPYGFPPVSIPPGPQRWHLSYGDDLHIAPEATVLAGRPAGVHRADWAQQWVREDARSMWWRRADVHHWPAFTLAVVWLCTPVVVARQPTTPAAWLALDDAFLEPAVERVKAMAHAPRARRSPDDVPNALPGWLPSGDVLRDLAAAVTPPPCPDD